MRFKAWHVELKRMFSPEELAEDQLTLLPTGRFINVSSIDTRLSQIISLDVMIPLQSTNLFDKNGKEIFEGDVVYEVFNGKDRGLSVVEIDTVNPCLCLVKDSSVEYDFVACGLRELEVVRNIYEDYK